MLRKSRHRPIILAATIVVVIGWASITFTDLADRDPGGAGLLLAQGSVITLSFPLALIARWREDRPAMWSLLVLPGLLMVISAAVVARKEGATYLWEHAFNVLTIVMLAGGLCCGVLLALRRLGSLLRA